MSRGSKCVSGLRPHRDTLPKRPQQTFKSRSFSCQSEYRTPITLEELVRIRAENLQFRKGEEQANFNKRKAEEQASNDKQAARMSIPIPIDTRVPGAEGKDQARMKRKRQWNEAKGRPFKRNKNNNVDTLQTASPHRMRIRQLRKSQPFFPPKPVARSASSQGNAVKINPDQSDQPIRPTQQPSSSQPQLSTQPTSRPQPLPPVQSVKQLQPTGMAPPAARDHATHVTRNIIAVRYGRMSPTGSTLSSETRESMAHCAEKKANREASQSLQSMTPEIKSMICNAEKKAAWEASKSCQSTPESCHEPEVCFGKYSDAQKQQALENALRSARKLARSVGSPVTEEKPAFRKEKAQVEHEHEFENKDTGYAINDTGITQPSELVSNTFMWFFTLALQLIPSHLSPIAAEAAVINAIRVAKAPQTSATGSSPLEKRLARILSNLAFREKHQPPLPETSIDEWSNLRSSTFKYSSVFNPDPIAPYYTRRSLRKSLASLTATEVAYSLNLANTEQIVNIAIAEFKRAFDSPVHTKLPPKWRWKAAEEQANTFFLDLVGHTSNEENYRMYRAFAKEVRKLRLSVLKTRRQALSTGACVFRAPAPNAKGDWIDRAAGTIDRVIEATRFGYQSTQQSVYPLAFQMVLTEEC